MSNRSRTRPSAPTITTTPHATNVNPGPIPDALRGTVNLDGDTYEFYGAVETEDGVLVPVQSIGHISVLADTVRGRATVRITTLSDTFTVATMHGASAMDCLRNARTAATDLVEAVYGPVYKVEPADAPVPTAESASTVTAATIEMQPTNPVTPAGFPPDYEPGTVPSWTTQQ